MARIRTIKPEFWTDEKILECSLNSRLLFLGLLNFADDFGNIEGSWKVIKSRIFPLDEIDIIPLLQELVHRKLIYPYTSENTKRDGNYYHIKGFRDHQRIDKPGKPRCPSYECSDNTPRVFVESSHNLIGGKGSSKGREGNKPIVQKKNFEQQRKDFEKVWIEYPEKKGKEKAWLKFKAQVKTPEDLKNICIALKNYKDDMESVRSNGHPDRAWQNGSTWFHQNWKDYIHYKPPPKTTKTPKKNIEWKKDLSPKAECMPPELVKQKLSEFTKSLKGVV